MKPLTPEIEYCRATVKSWEKLRFLYNAILILPGIAIILRAIYLQDQFMESGNLSMGEQYPIGHPIDLVASAFVFGFAANLCYCLGPYTEFVITALGFPISGQRSRYLLFGLGTMLSLAVLSLPWLWVEYYFVTWVTDLGP